MTPLVAVAVRATTAGQKVVGIKIAITLGSSSTLSGDTEFVEHDWIALRTAVGTFIRRVCDRNAVRIDIEGGGGDRAARTDLDSGHFRAARAITATLANGIARVSAKAGRGARHNDLVGCCPGTGDIERDACTPGGESHAVALLGRAVSRVGVADAHRITAGGRCSCGADARTTHAKSSPR